MATAIDRFLNYKIRDVELESRFRADRLQYDIGQARILTALVFLLFLVFIFLDPLLSVGENHVFNANIARLVAAFACMTAFFSHRESYHAPKIRLGYAYRRAGH